MRLLNPDSPLMELLTSLGEMMLLNLCFLIGCLPIVTIGASATAMYTMMGRRLRQEGSTGIIAPFFRAWWKNLLPAVPLWLAQVVVSCLLVSTFFLPLPGFVTIVAGVLLVIVTLVFSLIYPQVARFSNRCFGYLKNGVILSVYTLGWSLLNLGLFLAPVGLFLLFPVEFIQYSFLWLFLGFSGLYYLSARLMKRILAPLEEKAKNR